MIWVAVILLIVAAGAAFIVIARKGRELRRNQPLPPAAEKAFLRWQEDSNAYDRQVAPPFYLGNSAECNVVLQHSRVAYESCIFYHNNRFAFQTLPGGGPIIVNGEEKAAGYLWDGDVLELAGQTFRFVCY